jgi:hypothetical protein
VVIVTKKCLLFAVFSWMAGCILDMEEEQCDRLLSVAFCSDPPYQLIMSLHLRDGSMPESKVQN